MPDDPKTLTWYSKTNKRENSCTPVTCGCPLWFELHQQTAIKLLSNHTKNNEYKLEPGYEARAKRIAAIYAHLFLETLVLDDKAHPNQPIKFGNTNLRGRFYWMGLGAFASKTMAMVFGAIRTQLGYPKWVSFITDTSTEILTGEKPRVLESINILAKGNLWLAMDIIPWHLAWAQDKEGFKKCMNSRDFKEFKKLKPAIDSLPWSGSVPIMLSFPKDENGKPLPNAKQLGVTTEINNAFNTHLKEIERIFNDPKNITEHKKFTAAAKPLLDHLMQIAVQEQKNILQKICWDDPILQENVRIQRDKENHQIIHFLSIDPTVVFSSLYSYDVVKIARHIPMSDTSKAPKGPWVEPLPNTMVEDYDSRMEWIVEVAERYHELMIDEIGREYMLNELQKIATWTDSTLFGPEFLILDSSNDGKK